MQQFVDQAGYFNLMSRVDTQAVVCERGAVIALDFDETLHRFDVRTARSEDGASFRAWNAVGEPVARARQRWAFAPEAFVARPGRVPPPTPFVPDRSQRFAMLDAQFAFGGGDGFRGFGTGRTFPARGPGRPRTLAAAIGTIFDGVGRFSGHDEGTYVYCGELSPSGAFSGNLMLRVVDRQQSLRAGAPLPAMRDPVDAAGGVSWVVLRGEASPDDPVRPNVGPDGRPFGLVVEQGLRLQHIDCAADHGRGVRAWDRVGERVGKVTAFVAFDPASASGSSVSPVPFTAYDEFEFYDRDGRPAGGFTADSIEGRVFNSEVGGQPAIRFGGVGRLRGGRGAFENVRGLMTDNSLVMFTPHVSASVYVLRIDGGR
jgi:hypothetical protein